MSASPVSVRVTLDTEQLVAAMTRLPRREVQILSARLDAMCLTDAGVQGKFYARGALDPSYATPEARDAYLRALARIGEHSRTAVAAFLAGWAEHRDTEAVEPFVWHRLIGGDRYEVAAS